MENFGRCVPCRRGVTLERGLDERRGRPVTRQEFLGVAAKASLIVTLGWRGLFDQGNGGGRGHQYRDPVGWARGADVSRRLA